MSNVGRVEFPSDYISYGRIMNGYMRVDNYKISRGIAVHILVAEAFIPNDDETKIYVDHIDGVKTNNNQNNLRWVTQSENIQYAHDNGLIDMSSTFRSCVQCTPDGEEICHFKCIADAHFTTGIYGIGLSLKATLNGEIKYAGGFLWKDTSEKYLSQRTVL